MLREDVKKCVASDDMILVVSFDRATLGQTGTGFFFFFFIIIIYFYFIIIIFLLFYIIKYSFK